MFQAEKKGPARRFASEREKAQQEGSQARKAQCFRHATTGSIFGGFSLETERRSMAGIQRIRISRVVKVGGLFFMGRESCGRGIYGRVD